MSILISDISAALEEWAPVGTAQSYDNVGLQVGRSSAEVRRVLVSLDLTPTTIAEAKSVGADLILTHHPLLFKPIKRLSDDSLEAGMALELAELGIALFAAHTNLDAAKDGVSFELASILGLHNLSFLSGMSDAVVKLVVFVPLTHITQVQQAAHDAGGGQVGAYSDCSFFTGGTGQFTPGLQTSPFIGVSGGNTEKVAEARLELEVATWRLPKVLHAVKESHPYEEVAYDIIPVQQPFRNAGIGAIGDLVSAVSLAAFLNTVCEVLENPAVRYAGDLEAPIKRVAVCGGSGSDFISQALSSGADAFVTSDVTYHRYFEVLNSDGEFKMALIDPGHYESERCTESLLIRWGKKVFPSIEWLQTAHRSGPAQTWVKP